jgi:DNA polymerase III epsilon subunit-like protein
MNIFIDTETTGLIQYKGRKTPDFRELPLYDGCRIVSICWLVTQHDKVVEQAYFLVKPVDFTIPKESTKVHGITQDMVEKEGESIDTILKRLEESCEKCVAIVAHNIVFDVSVILSEAFRCGRENLVTMIQSKNHICTMQKGKEVMGVFKYPKLGELYKHLYKQDMKDAHNALADTMHCFKCYVKMFPPDKSVFFFKDHEIHLTPEQQAVVYEKIDSHMLVVAAAGSGKTTTTLTRIKYLIDQGIPEDRIMLTTFTWDAACDMKTKLAGIMGYTTKIKIGTIDGIAKSFVPTSSVMKHVGEYGYEFLDLIRKKPEIVHHYKYLFVDEFQDINDVQFQIIKEFYRHGVKLYAVGDDCQNIYSFRGSNVTYMTNFTEYFTDARQFFLTRNFRSTAAIVRMANASASCQVSAIPKVMVSAEEDASVSVKPVVQYFSHSSKQTTFVVNTIQELISTNKFKPEQIAVLSPMNQTLFAIEEELTKMQIPNVCMEGKTDVRTSRSNEHVSLCTIHKAKGLEWDVVFLINIGDDMIPKLKNDKNVQEDRRLFYVAITRPRKCLWLSYVAKSQTPYVSRFVSELPRSVYEFVDFSPKYIGGQSKADSFNIDTSIDKLVDLLDGSDFAVFKERNILPKEGFPCRRNVLYASFEYGKSILKDGLHVDFSNFLRLFILKEADVTKVKYLLHVNQVLSHIILPIEHYDMYKKYVKNRINVCNSDVPTKDVAQVSKIVRMITDRAAETSLQNPSLVSVGHSELIPKKFEEQLLMTLEKSRDDLQCLWTLSKCTRLIQEQRRRLLFKEQHDFTEHQELIHNMITLNPFAKNEACKVNYFVAEPERGIYGLVDIMIKDTLVMVKSSIKDDVDMNMLTMMLAQKRLCEIQGIVINHLIVFNPLRGWYVTYDVQNWQKGNELVDYCWEKRQSLLATKH